MKRRILGYAVLVYAALTSGATLGLARFIFVPGSDGLWLLGNTALWLGFVSGGFGLIFGRAWSRLVLLITAAASVVESIVGMVLVFLSGLGIPLEAVLFNALMALPPVAIFVGALSLPASAAWEVPPSSGPVAKRGGIDLAYGCFAWIAFVLCAGSLISLLPLDVTTIQVLGMVVGIPIVMATLAAGLAAVVLSVVQWREWPLLAMSTISASILLVFLAEDKWQLVGKGVALAWYVGSTAVLIFFCARWFIFTRRRASGLSR